jgi:hypothetical protein
MHPLTSQILTEIDRAMSDRRSILCFPGIPVSESQEIRNDLSYAGFRYTGFETHGTDPAEGTLTVQLEPIAKADPRAPAIP